MIGHRDRFGNTTTLTRNADQALTRIVSPNGRWLRFAHDASNRIVRAWASTGKSMDYEYDSEGHLAAARASTGQVQTYEYDASHRLIRIRESDGTEIVNDYDLVGRTTRQVVTYPPDEPGGPVPAPDIWELDYAGAGHLIRTVEVRRSGVSKRRLTFNANGYTLSDTRTWIDGAGVTITFARDLATNVVSNVRLVCRDAERRETVLQAAVGPGVSEHTVATTLCRQCSVPFIPDDPPGQ